MLNKKKAIAALLVIILIISSLYAIVVNADNEPTITFSQITYNGTETITPVLEENMIKYKYVQELQNNEVNTLDLGSYKIQVNDGENWSDVELTSTSFTLPTNADISNYRIVLVNGSNAYIIVNENIVNTTGLEGNSVYYALTSANVINNTVSVKSGLYTRICFENRANEIYNVWSYNSQSKTVTGVLTDNRNTPDDLTDDVTATVGLQIGHVENQEFIAEELEATTNRYSVEYQLTTATIADKYIKIVSIEDGSVDTNLQLAGINLAKNELNTVLDLNTVPSGNTYFVSLNEYHENTQPQGNNFIFGFDGNPTINTTNKTIAWTVGETTVTATVGVDIDNNTVAYATLANNLFELTGFDATTMEIEVNGANNFSKELTTVTDNNKTYIKLTGYDDGSIPTGTNNLIIQAKGTDPVDPQNNRRTSTVVATDGISVTVNGAYANNGTVEYPIEENATTVKVTVGDLWIHIFDSVTVNGVNIPVPTTRQGWSDILHGQEYVLEADVAVADSYVVEVTSHDATEEEIFIGNFLWETDPTKVGTEPDDLVNNGALEFVSLKYNNISYTLQELRDAVAAKTIPGWVAWDGPSGNETGGAAVLPIGSELTVSLIPNAGYQLTAFGINGGTFEPQQEIGTYTFEIRPGNGHFGATFTEVNNVVNPVSTKIDSGKVSLGGAEATMAVGTARLDVEDKNDLSQEQVSNFASAAQNEGYAVKNYLDISLYNTVYKGGKTDNNGELEAWDTQVKNLTNTATITLKLAEGVDGNSIVIIHELADENGNPTGVYEVIPCTYDPVTHTITFVTSSFSNYAIASATTGEVDNTALENIIETELGKLSQGATAEDKVEALANKGIIVTTSKIGKVEEAISDTTGAITLETKVKETLIVPENSNPGKIAIEAENNEIVGYYDIIVAIIVAETNPDTGAVTKTEIGRLTTTSTQTEFEIELSEEMQAALVANKTEGKQRLYYLYRYHNNVVTKILATYDETTGKLKGASNKFSLYGIGFEDVVCTHNHTQVERAKEATTTSTGYTGDTVCSDCGTILEIGSVIPKKTGSTKLTSENITLSKYKYQWNGKVRKPAVTVVVGDKTLVRNVDYKVAWYKNDKPGMGEVVVKGIGDYEGRIVIKFEIKPAVPTNLKLDPRDTGFRVRWTASDSDISGYQVVFATDPEFKNIVRAKRVGKEKVTFTGLQPGTYYVKVRSYVTEEETIIDMIFITGIINSLYSNVGTITVK